MESEIVCYSRPPMEVGQEDNLQDHLFVRIGHPDRSKQSTTKVLARSCLRLISKNKKPLVVSLSSLRERFETAPFADGTDGLNERVE